MSTYLKYNNRIIASGQPVPLVGRAEDMVRYGERWANRSVITLQGTLTGCTYTQILTAQSGLIQDFSKDFQPFQIVEDGNVIYNKPYAWISSINFGDSKYVGALGYTVTLECYDSGHFSGVWGVLEPVDEWSFDEQSDGKVRMLHNISARGFNTSSGTSNALDNAKNFVFGRTGWSGQISPAFITGLPPAPCLQSFGDKINRFDGTYSVTEEYIYDKFFSGSCVFLRYTTDYNCISLEGKATVSVRGEIQGSRAQTINDLRARYSGFDTFAAAQSGDESSSITNQYLSRGVTEDIASRRLNFEVLYDNTPVSASGVYFDYTTQVSTNDDGITNASINGTIRGRGDLTVRWNNVKSYYSTLDVFGLVNTAYSAAAQSTVPLNPYPLSSGVSYNQFSAELGLNASFDNRPTPTGDDFSEIEINYSFQNGVQKVGATPLLINECGKPYYVVDLGYQTRAQFSLDGTAKPVCGKTASETLPALKAHIDAIRAQEANGARMVLLRQEFTTSEQADGQVLRFACAWSFEGSSATSPSSYSQIALLGTS